MPHRQQVRGNKERTYDRQGMCKFSASYELERASSIHIQAASKMSHDCRVSTWKLSFKCCDGLGTCSTSRKGSWKSGYCTFYIYNSTYVNKQDVISIYISTQRAWRVWAWGPWLAGPQHLPSKCRRVLQAQRGLRYRRRCMWDLEIQETMQARAQCPTSDGIRRLRFRL